VTFVTTGCGQPLFGGTRWPVRLPGLFAATARPGWCSYNPGVTPTTGERLGIFGGTFDPPHVGHLVAAINVRHALALDRVLLTVSNRPWQKVGSRPLSHAADRLAMVRAAVASVDGLEASDLEVRRGGDSYTVDTIAELLEQDPTRHLFVIVGQDAAAGMPTWDRIDEVRRRSELVVVERPGVGSRLPPGWRFERVEVPRLEVSSTDLRARVVDGRPLDFLVPEGAISVLEERRLYREGCP
jgi:nicotinate-nucleotide adenylyltransferase